MRFQSTATPCASTHPRASVASAPPPCPGWVKHARTEVYAGEPRCGEPSLTLCMEVNNTRPPRRVNQQVGQVRPGFHEDGGRWGAAGAQPAVARATPFLVGFASACDPFLFPAPFPWGCVHSRAPARVCRSTNTNMPNRCQRNHSPCQVTLPTGIDEVQIAELLKPYSKAKLLHLAQVRRW